ncbi:MAG: hypothetical protein KF893_24545 [Caldilineaceae bacterium]|nr:hypothetical protein [Caldilineaceae bacterium]
MVNFLELIPTERPPFLDSMAEMASKELVQGFHNDQPSPPMFLTSARPFLGNLWLPSYLPKGFDIKRAEVTNPTRDHPDLIFPSNIHVEGGHGHIILTADYTEKYTHEYVPVHLNDYVELITVRGRDGLLIRGGWLNILSEDGVVRYSGWDDQHTCKLIIKDTTQNQIITLEARPASLVSTDELLRVAESLEMSSVFRSWLPWLRRS